MFFQTNNNFLSDLTFCFTLITIPVLYFGYKITSQVVTGFLRFRQMQQLNRLIRDNESMICQGAGRVFDLVEKMEDHYYQYQAARVLGDFSGDVMRNTVHPLVQSVCQYLTRRSEPQISPQSCPARRCPYVHRMAHQTHEAHHMAHEALHMAHEAHHAHSHNTCGYLADHPALHAHSMHPNPLDVRCHRVEPNTEPAELLNGANLDRIDLATFFSGVPESPDSDLESMINPDSAKECLINLAAEYNDPEATDRVNLLDLNLDTASEQFFQLLTELNLTNENGLFTEAIFNIPEKFTKPNQKVADLFKLCYYILYLAKPCGFDPMGILNILQPVSSDETGLDRSE